MSLTGIDPSGGASGSGNVAGAASSVDGEIVLFSGTTGKALKRATGSGIVAVASGVLSASTAPTFTDFTNAGHSHVDAAHGGSIMAGDPYELDTIGNPTGSSLGLGTVTQNQLYLYLLRVQKQRSTTVVNVANGGTVNGHFAVSIGTISGGTWTASVSTGEILQSGSTALQSPSIAMTWLPDVDYYVGFATDSATATFGRLVSNLAAMAAAGGIQWTKASAYSAGITSPQSSLTASSAHTIWMRFT